MGGELETLEQVGSAAAVDQAVTDAVHPTTLTLGPLPLTSPQSDLAAHLARKPHMNRAKAVSEVTCP
jgi:hypothetical protein